MPKNGKKGTPTGGHLISPYTNVADTNLAPVLGARLDQAGKGIHIALHCLASNVKSAAKRRINLEAMPKHYAIQSFKYYWQHLQETHGKYSWFQSLLAPILEAFFCPSLNISRHFQCEYLILAKHNGINIRGIF